MGSLGFKVDYIDKPETIEPVRSKKDAHNFYPINWDEDSDKRVQQYLIDSGADGGLVIDSNYRENFGNLEGHITIQPYKLIKPGQT